MKLAAQFRRPAVEFGRLLADPVFWGWNVPRGDGRPVYGAAWIWRRRPVSSAVARVA